MLRRRLSFSGRPPAFDVLVEITASDTLREGPGLASQHSTLLSTVSDQRCETRRH